MRWLGLRSGAAGDRVTEQSGTWVNTFSHTRAEVLDAVAGDVTHGSTRAIHRDYQRDMFDVAELARRYGISRKDRYKWIDRYDVGGPVGLVDRSRRPAHCPHERPRGMIAALLDVRRHHPTWGAKKLLKIVARRHPTWTLPARSTVCDLLDRAGLITGARRRPVPAHPGGR